MKRLVIIALILFLSSNISAVCTEGQIDVNTASLEELDNLAGVGPATAQNIIDTRPYINLDDLIRASGIGEIKLAGIKSQGIACVGGEVKEDIKEENNERVLGEEEAQEEELVYEYTSKTEKQTSIVPIRLEVNESKDIKSDEDKEKLKSKLALYGIITFCAVFGAMFLLRKGKYKNEFQ